MNDDGEMYMTEETLLQGMALCTGRSVLFVVTETDVKLEMSGPIKRSNLIVKEKWWVRTKSRESNIYNGELLPQQDESGDEYDDEDMNEDEDESDENAEYGMYKQKGNAYV